MFESIKKHFLRLPQIKRYCILFILKALLFLWCWTSSREAILPSKS